MGRPLVIVFSFCLLSAAHLFGGKQQDEFPVLRVRTLQSHPRSDNQTTPLNGSVPLSFACNFTQQSIERSIEVNCSAYVQPLEASAGFASPQDRLDSIDRFSNCTYHQIFSQFPDSPTGMASLEYQDGQLSFEELPNGLDAARYGPLPPVSPASGTGQPTPQFLPIFKDATQSFFDDLALTLKCNNHPTSSFSYGNASNATSTFSTYTDNSGSSNESTAAWKLYQAIDVATQQYTRCTFQNAADVADCTVQTTQKLHWLPSSFFVFVDATSCDSKMWAFVSVGVSVLIDFIHHGAMKWRKGGTGAFSWLTFLFTLAKGLGQPAIEALVLHHSATTTSSTLLIAAMKFLQPTSAPLLALFTAWFLSKGQAFQILATDAVVTMAGVVLSLLATSGELLQIASGAQSALAPAGEGLAVLGLLLAVGPWGLVYVLLGVFALPVQLGFILGFVEAWLLDTSYCFTIAFGALFLLILVLLFVGFTPIWALWELVWTVSQKLKARKEKKRIKEIGLMEDVEREKPVFPLAETFRMWFQNGSTWKRVLAKFIFGLFVILSFVSFVGKWMLMVNLLGAAGDAYCPSSAKESAFAGLGERTLMASIGLALHFTGLTV